MSSDANTIDLYIYAHQEYQQKLCFVYNWFTDNDNIYEVAQHAVLKFLL